MTKRLVNWWDNLLASLAFIAPLFFYWRLAASTVQLEDAGELITAALTWGIPHPSGYPLYVITAGLWAHVFGHGPLAINLLSGLWAALACLFVYKTARFWLIEPWLALSAAWLLAGWGGLWSQAVVSEVYSLYVFLLSLLVYSAARFDKNKNPTWLYLIFGLAGLSVSAHLLAVWLWPILLIFYARNLWALNFKRQLMVVAWFLAGLLPYLYLPWRALNQPLLNWGQPDNWLGFWHHVLRLGYNDLSWPIGFINKTGLIGNLLLDLISGWGWLILLILVLGLIINRKNNHRQVIGLLALVFSQILPVVYLRRYGWGLGPSFTYSVYWSGSIMAMALLFGLAADSLKNSLPKAWHKIFYLVVFLCLPWSTWYSNYKTFDYSTDNWPENYVDRLISHLPNQSILFIWGEDYANDSLLFTVAYVKMVKRLRPDITVIDGGVVFPIVTPTWGTKEADHLLSVWRYGYLTNRPVYSSRLPTTGSFLVGRLDGYAYRLFGSPTEANVFKGQPFLLPPQIWTVNRIFYYSGQDYLAHLLYGQSLALWQLGRIGPAQAFLRQAIYYDNEPFSQDYWRLVRQRNLLNNLN